MRDDAPGIGVPDAFLNRREMPRLNRHEILNRLLDDPRLRPVERMGNVGHLFIELRGQPDAHGQGFTHICRDVSHIKLQYTTTCLPVNRSSAAARGAFCRCYAELMHASEFT